MTEHLNPLASSFHEFAYAVGRVLVWGGLLACIWITAVYFIQVGKSRRAQKRLDDLDAAMAEQLHEPIPFEQTYQIKLDIAIRKYILGTDDPREGVRALARAGKGPRSREAVQAKWDKRKLARATRQGSELVRAGQL